MRLYLVTLILFVFSHGSVAARKDFSCDEQLTPAARTDDRPTLRRDQVAKITAQLRTPLKTGLHGVRIITDEVEETPDPDRPLQFTLPNGKTKYMIGFSGQKAIYVDNLKNLFEGGIHRTQPIELFNRNGYQYGVEVDPATGKKIHYAHNSSLWDIYAVPYKKADGSPAIKMFAGGMGDYASGPKAGQPLMPGDGFMTRQRLFFEGEFQYKAGNINNGLDGFTLIGSGPYAPLNRLTPRQGQWILKDRHGTGFQHGYGGGPVTLANGDLYTTKEGWVPFIHESVIEQKRIRSADGNIQVLPFLTVQSVTYLDPTLTQVMSPTRTIWSPIRADGTVFEAALRHEWSGSPLTEGLHVNPKSSGKVIGSAEELAEIRARGDEIILDGMHSHGEYYGEYGGSGIKFDENFESAKPLVDEHGEIEDFLKPLAPIFAWRGRPCSTFIDGQEYVMAHAVDRSKIPSGILMNRMPKKGEDWVHFNRQIIAFPIERYMLNGSEHIRIKDNTGLLELLSKYRAVDKWE